MLVHTILASTDRIWPPFVLVAGLLLIGRVAAEDRLFEAVGARIARSRLSAEALLLALLALVAVVTAVLNLDTAVVFLTPVLVHAARERNLDERPFLYGSVFMANAASLLLPGSNLTNLLVLRNDPQDGLTFAARMLPAWSIACLVTAAFVAMTFRLVDRRAPHDQGLALPPLRLGAGAVATVAAATLVVTLPNAALPVLAVGLIASGLRSLTALLDVRAFALLFALAVALGTLARLWHGPSRLLDSTGTLTTAAVGALAALLVNNLPAAVLLSVQPAAHPDALLLGLNLGPNLAVTGSLSALLWLQTARAIGARPSITTYTTLGLILVPLSLGATLATLAL